MLIVKSNNKYFLLATQDSPQREIPGYTEDEEDTILYL